MTSLSNAFNFEELEDFYNRVKKEIDSFELISELKIDGLAISLIYENGSFVKLLLVVMVKLEKMYPKMLKLLKHYR